MTTWGWVMMIGWSLVWLGVLATLGWVAVTWVRAGSTDTIGQRQTKTARELLDERLAKGEIDVEEYQRTRAALEHSSVGG